MGVRLKRQGMCRAGVRTNVHPAVLYSMLVVGNSAAGAGGWGFD